MLFTLFIASFLSATILPFPSEAVFLYALSSGTGTAACLVTATAGNSLGGATTFFLGRAGRIALGKKSPAYGEFVLRYGSLAAVFSWVPFVGDILLLALGVLPLPVWRTLAWMITGKFLRYAVLTAVYACS